MHKNSKENSHKVKKKDTGTWVQVNLQSARKKRVTHIVLSINIRRTFQLCPPFSNAHYWPNKAPVPLNRNTGPDFNSYKVGHCWQISKIPPRYWRTQEKDRARYLFQCSKATTEGKHRSKLQEWYKTEGNVSYGMTFISVPHYKPFPLTPRCTTLTVTSCHI